MLRSFQFCLLSKAIMASPLSFILSFLYLLLLLLVINWFFPHFLVSKPLCFLSAPKKKKPLCSLLFFLDQQPSASVSLSSQPLPMKDSAGKSHPCPALKSLFTKIGGNFCHSGSPDKYKRLDGRFEKKMIEVKRSSLERSRFKSINSIIMRFSQLKEGLKNIRVVFEQYDEDANGIIDYEELKNCLHKLQLSLKEEEIKDLFHYCDVDGSKVIEFNEFVVLLCLIYLLVEPSSSPHNTSKMGLPELEATFDHMVEAFLFLDKKGKGKLRKKDMIKALNDAYPWEKSPAHITKSRFKEMDWDRNGRVTFREFLFAFINWVGIDDDEEIPTTES